MEFTDKTLKILRFFPHIFKFACFFIKEKCCTLLAFSQIQSTYMAEHFRIFYYSNTGKSNKIRPIQFGNASIDTHNTN